MNSHGRMVCVAVAVALVLGASGCTSSGGGRSRGGGAGHGGSGAPIDVRSLPVYDGATGSPLDWPTLVARCAGADVVLIGEVHGHETGGAASVALFEDVVARAGSTAALSMEFFQRDEQAGVDDYLTGLCDEQEFRTRMNRTDENYPPAHSAMVNAANIAGRPVIASNAPRRYVAVARIKGYDRLRELTPDQKQLFVVPEAEIEGGYRDRFHELMAGMVAAHAGSQGHGTGAEEEAGGPEAEAAAKEMLDGYYRAQNVWDATMAASIASAAARGYAPVVHVVGQFHTDFDGGLTQRVRGLMPGATVVTVSLVDAATMKDEDRGRADVIICIGAE